MSKYFPIIQWLSNYQRAHLSPDFFSGLTIGVMLIPQGMAYAMIAGLPPVYGLYASLLPQIMYAIFGTSRQLSVGPVAMDSLLVAAGISVLATEGSETYIALAIMLAFFMGLFQLLLGLSKMGFIVNFLSKPVISGFTSAAALIIGLNQLKHLLGIEIQKSSKVYEILISVFDNIQDIHWMTLIIGISSILIIKGIKKVHKNIPAALVTVALGSIIVFLFRMDLVGVNIVKSIPSGLPSLKFPDFSIGFLSDIIPLAMTISIVAFMESISVAKALQAKRKDHKIDANQELIGLGMANLIGSLAQSYPVTGGFSRSAVNYQSGARTPLASIISAVLIGFTLLFLTPLFYYLPNAVLAAIILVAIFSLIDIKYPIYLWKVNKTEFFLLLVTVLVTINFSMVPGIVTGMILSLLIMVYKASHPHIAKLERVNDSSVYRNVNRFSDTNTDERLLIFRFDAPLFFANIDHFRDYIFKEIESKNEQVKGIVIDASAIANIDSTAGLILIDIIEELKNAGVKVMIASAIGPFRDLLHKYEIVEVIGKQNLFVDVNNAVDHFLGKKISETAHSIAKQTTWSP